jgi:hypothetical protein
MKMENSIFDINMMECACIRNNNPFWRIFCWTMGYFWCIVMCQAIYFRKSEPAGREKILKLSFYSILVWVVWIFFLVGSFKNRFIMHPRKYVLNIEMIGLDLVVIKLSNLWSVQIEQTRIIFFFFLELCHCKFCSFCVCLIKVQLLVTDY